jgi:uncharacterized oxidoreductase
MFHPECFENCARLILPAIISRVARRPAAAFGFAQPHPGGEQRSLHITSELASAPLARTPVYSATKAALHSFTRSLRHLLKDTPVKVIEIAPPAVTALGEPGLHTFGVNVDEFADAVFAKLAEEDLQIGYGFGEKARTASRAEARINDAQP